MTGLVPNSAAAVLVLEELLRPGRVAFIVGFPVMDTFDAPSRMSGKCTLFGVSRFHPRPDRGGPGADGGGLYFADRDAVEAALCVAVVLGSLMVSHARPRGGARSRGKVGIATRPVRVVLQLSIGLVFGAGDLISDVDLLSASIYVMTVLTAFTVGQRVWHVRGEFAGARGRRAARRCNQRGKSGSSPSTRRQEDVFSMSEHNGHADGAASNGHRVDDGKVRVAIVGVGNCANAFIQVEYYKDADPADQVPGLMHDLGGYHVRDIEFVAAFDIDSEKASGRTGGDLVRVRTTRSSSPRCPSSGSRSSGG